jgi:hypothetical protein
MSPRLTQTVETTVEVEVDAELLQLLVTETNTYESLKDEFDDMLEDLETLKARIESIRAEAGVKKIVLPDGYGVTRVDGQTSRSLSKKKVYALGITAKQLEDCYVNKPKKGHTLVITPKSTAKAEAAKKKQAPRDERDVEDDE